jgi:hypothetical protein
MLASFLAVSGSWLQPLRTIRAPRCYRIKIRNPKLEIRNKRRHSNPKFKIKIRNEPLGILSFLIIWICFDLPVSDLVFPVLLICNCFEFRISCFEFAFWALGVASTEFILSSAEGLRTCFAAPRSNRSVTLFHSTASLRSNGLSGLNCCERFELLVSAASAIGEFKSVVGIRLEMHSLDPR